MTVVAPTSCCYDYKKGQAIRLSIPRSPTWANLLQPSAHLVCARGGKGLPAWGGGMPKKSTLDMKAAMIHIFIVCICSFVRV